MILISKLFEREIILFRIQRHGGCPQGSIIFARGIEN